MTRIAPVSLLLVTVLLLGGCGIRGSLKLPEEEQATPLQPGSASPASDTPTPPAATAHDAQAANPSPTPTYVPRDPERNWRRPDPLEQVRELHRRR